MGLKRGGAEREFETHLLVHLHPLHPLVWRLCILYSWVPRIRVIVFLGMSRSLYLDCDVMGNFTRPTSAYLPPLTVTSWGILLGLALFSYFTLTSWRILLGICHKNRTTYIFSIHTAEDILFLKIYSYVKTEKSRMSRLLWVGP